MKTKKTVMMILSRKAFDRGLNTNMRVNNSDVIGDEDVDNDTTKAKKTVMMILSGKAFDRGTRSAD